MRKIYLDYAATTYIDPIVLDKMLPFLKGNFGNPSSLYSIGRQAKMGIEYARVSVAKILGASSQEIIFTGSGTESDNLAIFGVAKFYQNKGKHIIVSKIEHKAVLEAAKKLGKEGFEIIYLDVDSKGLVNLLELKKSLRSDTILVSVMYANNEIGTIQPIAKISEIIREFRKENLLPLFHTDACQAAGALTLNVKKLGVDLLTINGSKIYGPKGVGCLYKAKDIKLDPIIVGGGQENNLRAGTENVALIAGFGEALKLAEKLRLRESRRLKKLRDYLIKRILKIIPHSQLNGHPEKRLSNNINISIASIEGEALVLMLDKYGVFASTGSACASHDLNPSHVLLAMGLAPELAHGSLRLTLGRKTTKMDLDYVMKILPEIIYKLRKISSISSNYKK
ncbi:MAG: cysteine desulfurase NifS [Candidatus Nealsonbacteria bacterium CG_4_9_14_0_8_um_filter_35_12]|uniref:Cysteine desulfurase NifS n=1 Tax=Candidatus Nealsonbacteria bacterium CG_4_9_14_0_8_um_filter_35_12 TaxID=1974692 RepID=A0A2M8DMT4_9BACT|nr:MAG: cysteine desulfurase NifS [Candidatus Nealsonbacteria bacterium CG_4_9_14_0_8_um_filter_35_12]